MLDALLAWGHYISFMVLFSAVLAEHLLFDDIAAAPLARRLSILDAICGVAALLVLITGVTKVMTAPQGAAWFMQIWIFHAKVTLFFVIALISIWPTIHFMRGRRKLREGAAQVTYPRLLRVALRIEMVGLLILPLLAAMMARGIGYTGT